MALSNEAVRAGLERLHPGFAGMEAEHTKLVSILSCQKGASSGTAEEVQAAAVLDTLANHLEASIQDTVVKVSLENEATLAKIGRDIAIVEEYLPRASVHDAATSACLRLSEFVASTLLPGARRTAMLVNARSAAKNGHKQLILVEAYSARNQDNVATLKAALRIMT
jgi:hypothetical protein